jgi:hypothetical protein
MDKLGVSNRQELLGQMHPTTKTVAQACLDKLVAASKIGALIYYDMGSAINTLFASAEISDSRKQQELKKLSAYLGQDFSVGMLTNLKNVAATFTREYIVEQVSSPLRNGKYLTWSHFYELQKITSDARRETLLTKTRANSWSAKELSLELASNQESDIKRNGGRKPGIPKSANAMLQKLINSTQSTANYVDVIADPLTTALGEIDLNNVDSALVTNIAGALTQVEETAARLASAKAQLVKWQKKIKAKQK